MDHKPQKGTPVFQIDISKKADRKILEDILSTDCILYCHFAPPCGTASAARQIKPGPPPLRSVRFPMGFKHLKGINKQRVIAANFLYRWTKKMIVRLERAGAAWSVENPASSLMWLTDPFVELINEIPSLIAFSFHTCMFQAKRKKDTAIWTSIKELRSHLERKCDGQHEHLAWGKSEKHDGFATADECAYNENMCASWAQAVFDFAVARGFHVPASDMQDDANGTEAAQINKTILGCLPRGRKVPPLLTDWLEPQLFQIDDTPAVQTLPIGKRIPDSVQCFPQGSKLVRFTNENGEVLDLEREVLKHNMQQEDASLSKLPSFALIGIPREPQEFVFKACSLVHPVLRAMQVGSLMLDAIDSYELGDKMEFRRIQCRFSQDLLRKAGELKSDEDSLHAGMAEHLQRVLKGKRLCLFQKLLVESGYPDSKVADEMAAGFPLCGWLPTSDVFPSKLRPPVLHMDTLEKMSASFAARSIGATKASGEAAMDRLLWDATMDEVQAGFLSGPYDTKELPKGAIASPRFGLLQKSKLRPIDNFSASHINSATGLRDKLQVDSIDEICAMIKAWAQRSSGTPCLVGRSYDLRKAYRQIGIAPDHLKFAWISVWSPDDAAPRLFRMDSMPFGATASVGAFLRLSQALKCLGISQAALVWSSFYDDFVCVCPPDAAIQVDRMIRLFFKALGWQLSTDEAKDHAFCSKFQALGVEFDLSTMHLGYFSVGNTPSRKAELSSRIDDILGADLLSVAEATSLRSRLLFADAQVFGRFAKAALHEIGRVGLDTSDMSPLSPSVRQSLLWLRDRVLSGPPRKIDFRESETFYLFLDGACTDTMSDNPWCGTSIGGVLVFPDGSVRECFGEILPHAWMADWGWNKQQQYIFEAEIMPYAISLMLWKRHLAGKCIFVFIDNEGARAAWISGFAATKAAQHMLHLGTAAEAELGVHPYFARVPTHSNLGDAPSRGKFDVIEKLGGFRTQVPLGMIECLMKHGGGSTVPFECEWG